MKRGQPYLGAFLLKDEKEDSDVIRDINEVHDVGVFAQITSVFAASASGTHGEGGEKEEALTAVLYPHRRIRITDLVQAGGGAPTLVKVKTEQEQEPGTDVPPTPPASPSPESASESSATKQPSSEALSAMHSGTRVFFLQVT